MRTTIDLPEELLDEVQRVTQASTRRDALMVALEDYLRRRRIRAVIDAAGTLEFDVDPRALRSAGNSRVDG